MAARNPREAGLFGVSPQTFNSPTADKFNREAGATIAELQKKVEAITPVAPAEGEAPADTPLFALRTVGHGWPFVTAAVTVSGINLGVDVPGTGVGLGTLYKGERVVFQFNVDDMSSTGVVYFRLSLLGLTGQGSPEAVIAEHTPYLPNPLAPPSPTVFAGAVFEVPRQISEARLRVQLGSGGGTGSIPNTAPMLQYFQIYTPIRRPAS